MVATRAWLSSDFQPTAGKGADSTQSTSLARQTQSPTKAPEDVSAATGEALREPDPLARVAGVAEMLPHLSGKNALEVLDASRSIKKEKGIGLAAEGELILLQVGRTAGLAAL